MVIVLKMDETGLVERPCLQAVLRACRWVGRCFGVLVRWLAERRRWGVALSAGVGGG